MIERVRAVLITPTGTMLAIKRTRPGIGPCWGLPCGHAEAGDAGHRAALDREVR